jgi:4-amino-4-deoxy-L-arabinose transferase-like glycosyltransferase
LLSALVALSAALYCFDLGRTPVYLAGDEANFGVQAHSIARSGRDLDGRFMPLFFHLTDPLGDQDNTDLNRRWYQPVLFYVIAVALRFLPLSEASIRLPTALIGGVLNPLLMYAIGRRLFQSRLHAVFATLMLVSSPPL